MTPTVTPISPAIGAEIVGLSGHELVNPDAAERWRSELERYGVLVFREINISDDDLVAFSKLLGEVVKVRTVEHAHPEIAIITLDPSRTNAVLASYRQGNFLWHIDGATDEYPQKTTLLTTREVDDAGGDTEFASTYSSFDALTEDEKERIKDLKVIHSFARRAARPSRGKRRGTRELGVPTSGAPARLDASRWPQVPLARCHHVGGGRLVTGGRASAARPAAEWSTQPEFSLRHQWRKGDLVIWDNTGMLHHAMPFEPTSRRSMHRTTLVGEEMVV